MNPFEAIKDVFRELLVFLHDDVGFSFGWAIVATTVIVRIVILPLFIKQYRSMRRMQAYAPQLKEIQRKYKGNRQKLNEELMRFYKENQINPFGSCLPLIAQAPVFFALYFVLREFSREAEGRPGLDFMWIIPDVAENLLDIGWGAAVLLAIYALSQLLASELSMTPATPSNQKWLMRGLPLIVVVGVTTYRVPAGIVIYWLTTNLWTTGQQLVLKRRIGPRPVLEESTPAGRPGARTSRTAPKPVAAAVAEGEAGRVESGRRRRPRTAPPEAGPRPELRPETAADEERPAEGRAPEPRPARRRPRGASGARRQPKKRR